MGLELIDTPRQEKMREAFNAGATACLVRWEGFDFFAPDSWPKSALPIDGAPVVFGLTALEQEISCQAYQEGYLFIQTTMSAICRDLSEQVAVRIAVEKDKPNG